MRSRCVGAATVGISYQGIPLAEWGLGRTNGRAALPILDAECGDDSSDPYDASASNVDQRAEMRVGSVSKSISAAVLRWALKERYHQLTGGTLTDAALEAMPVLGDDFPGGLLPDDLRVLLAGDAPLPAEITSCDELDGAADARWETVTLGHLLSHRAGLTRSSPSLESVVIPNLPVLRGLDTPEAFAAEDAAARAGASEDSVDAARAALDGGAAGDISFVRPPTTVDVLKAQAGRCLEFVDDGGNTITVGDYSYSNTSPVFWGVVMEHVTGVPYSSASGDPASHAGTLLQQFFESELGLDSTAGSGVFRQPASIDASEPVVVNPRHWTPSQETMRPASNDDKRPHCRLVDSVCSFDEWVDGARANWQWELETVPFERSGVGVGAAQGGLMISPRFMLEFMSNYWVEGYGADPRIGEPRNDMWTSGEGHNGEMAGTRAVAKSYSGNHSDSYAVPALGDDGRLTDDFDHRVLTGEWLPPHGLDVFVAINQSTDPKCQASEARNAPTGRGSLDSAKLNFEYYTCNEAVGMLTDYLVYGLSQVDWDAVIDAVESPNAELNIPDGPMNKTFG